jgi:protein phosphatase
MLAALIAGFWPWGVLLLWPMLALIIVASAYFGLGPVIFHKADGRLHWSARLVLAPCLLGQQLSLLYYKRQGRAWDEVTPGVWIGRVLNDREAAAATQLGLTAVLDLTAEFPEATAFRVFKYRNIPILDLTAPSTHQLQEMAAFIENESRQGVVYVHCKIGYSRTAAAAAAYLLQSGKAAGVAEAIARLRQVRPAMVVRLEIVEALNAFANVLTPVVIPEAALGMTEGFSSPPRNARP